MEKQMVMQTSKTKRRASLPRRISLLACVFALLPISANAQPQTANQTPPSQIPLSLAADWQATIHGTKGDERVVLHVLQGSGGNYHGLLYNLDGAPLPQSVPQLKLQGDDVTFALLDAGIRFSGKLGADGKTLTGTWNVGAAAQPVTLTRASKESTWVLPKDPLPPTIAVDAHPSFEVATIKPHEQGKPGGGYRWIDARKFQATLPVDWLVRYVYGVQDRQVIGLPEWAHSDMYDYSAVPDMPGLPTEQQRIEMMRKMLEERFALKVHHETRTMPAFQLSVLPSGVRMTPSVIRDPGASLFGRADKGGLHLPGRNVAMSDLIRFMQQIVGRPVVDKTGLTGQFDFDMEWTPDASQFGGHFPEPGPDDPILPSLANAMRDQMGLKLTSFTGPVDVIVVDHLERPTDN